MCLSCTKKTKGPLICFRDAAFPFRKHIGLECPKHNHAEIDENPMHGHLSVLQGAMGEMNEHSMARQLSG